MHARKPYYATNVENVFPALFFFFSFRHFFPVVVAVKIIQHLNGRPSCISKSQNRSKYYEPSALRCSCVFLFDEDIKETSPLSMASKALNLALVSGRAL